MKVRIEIGENLFLEVLLKYTPPKAGYISGPPENCYPDEPSEISWEDADVWLVAVDTSGKEKMFLAPDEFSNVYFDMICEEADNEYRRASYDRG